MARFLSISSGSNGNCYYVGDERTALIVDAGVGFRTVKSRLAGAGVDISSVEMIFVTHDHVDHIRGLASVAQRLSVPVYATARLHDALSRHKAVGPEIGGSRRVLRPGVETEMRGVKCLTFEVPHDATQTLGYRLDFFGTKFVFMTDLGRVPEYAYDICRDADYLIIESNYDVDMLMRGSYPPDLKSRILGDSGHLSNDDCAAALRRLWHPGLRGIFLCHLSKDNNTPSLAYASALSAVESMGLSVPDDLQLVCLPMIIRKLTPYASLRWQVSFHHFQRIYFGVHPVFQPPENQ